MSRAEVWLKAWAAVAYANDYKDAATCKAWADKCLKDYDERFPPKKEDPVCEPMQPPGASMEQIRYAALMQLNTVIMKLREDKRECQYAMERARNKIEKAFADLGLFKEHMDESQAASIWRSLDDIHGVLAYPLSKPPADWRES